MPDFSQLLKRPTGQGKRPKALPTGSYPCVIKNWEAGDKNKNNTPYVRLHLGFTGWPESVDESDRFQEGLNGQLVPIDITKRQLSRDIYYVGKDGSDQTYRIDDVLKACGIELGRPYEETLPLLIGKHGIAAVSTYVSDKTGEIGNQVDNFTGLNE